jgi:homoserine kinase type II
MIESVLRREWVLAHPVSLEPMTNGTNNQSFLVTTGQGRFVLKRYRNAGRVDRRRFERRLLDELAHADLPFAVPSIIPTVTGEASAQVTRDDATYYLALFRHLPGSPPQREDSEVASSCGAALAMLDRALAAIPVGQSGTRPVIFGDLAEVHPAVPYPISTIERVISNRELAVSIGRILAHAEDGWTHCTADWRLQMIYGDFYPANVLMTEGRVTGILDFEFAGPGHRAMDFAIGLGAFSTREWREGCSWRVLEAFATGYLWELPLSLDELAATPAMLLMREATSFVHWLGRRAEGLTTLADVHDRAARLLSVSAWLDAHQADLVDRLGRLCGS